MTKPNLQNPSVRKQFFAQYFHQYVFVDPHTSAELVTLIHGELLYASGRAYLSLRSVSSLTEEETRIVSDLLHNDSYEFGTHEDVISILQSETPSDYWLEDISGLDWLDIYDYLRSIGIAIPWRGWSVEELVNAGLVVIRKEGE